MYSVSKRYREGIANSHQSILQISVYDGNDNFLQHINISGGSVSVDSRAAIHRRAKLDIMGAVTNYKAEDVLTAGELAELLYPRGHEIHIKRGIVYPDFTSELCPLGVFRIARPRFSRTQEAGVKVSVDLYDRSRRIARAKYTRPRVIPQGTNGATAMRMILTDAWPGVPEANFALTDFETPKILIDAGSDPWDEASKIAASLGQDLFFDTKGWPVSRIIRPPDEASVVWRYLSDSKGMLLGIERDVDDENAYNHVVIKADNSELEEPIYSEALDNDPKSPTYVGSPVGSSVYGDVVLYMENQLITSQAQGNAVALGELRRNQGIIEQANFTTIVNPAHETGDVVQVQNIESTISGLYVLDGFTIPLGHDEPMPVTTRQVRVFQ